MIIPDIVTDRRAIIMPKGDLRSTLHATIESIPAPVPPIIAKSALSVWSGVSTISR